MEAQRQELVKEQELVTANLEKYKDKMKKLEEMKKKWNNLLVGSGEEPEGVVDSVGNKVDSNKVVELVDSAGERKFVTTKRDQVANSYLADKNTYHLALVRKA